MPGRSLGDDAHLEEARVPVTLSQDAEADALLERDPLALLIGMVLDQQIPLDKALSSPLECRVREYKQNQKAAAKVGTKLPRHE